MSVVVGSLLELDHSYARELPGLSVSWTAALVPAPAVLMLNEELATELGVDPEALREPDGVALLVVTRSRTGCAQSRRLMPAISSAAMCPGWETAGRCCSAS